MPDPEGREEPKFAVGDWLLHVGPMADGHEELRPVERVEWDAEETGEWCYFAPDGMFLPESVALRVQLPGCGEQVAAALEDVARMLETERLDYTGARRVREYAKEQDHG